MPSQIQSGTQSATLTTEHSLYSTTTPGIYAITVNTTNMAISDELELYAKEKTLSGSTAEIVWFESCAHVQIEKNKKSFWIDVAHHVEFFLKQNAGTGRSYEWSVRRLDTVMGTVTLADAAVDAIWDETQSGHTSAGTFGKYLDQQVSTISGGGGSDPDDIADALLDRANAIETNITVRKLLKALSAFLLGKASGGGSTTITFRDYNDTKTVITYTLTNTTDGNRSSVSANLT